MVCLLRRHFEEERLNQAARGSGSTGNEGHLVPETSSTYFSLVNFCAHTGIARLENTRIKVCLGPEAEQKSMAIARQVITSLLSDGTDMLGTKSLAVKIADENIVSGSLLTVESNHFCV